MPSSVVKHVEYLADRRILRVTFLSGLVYDYLNVPEKVYKEMKASASKGRFLNYRIKDHFDYVKTAG